MQEITAASIEQETGVSQVAVAMEHLDKVSQHGAASAEELSATAEELQAQAELLKESIAFFTLNESHFASSAGKGGMKSHASVGESSMKRRSSPMVEDDFERMDGAA